MVRLTQDAWCVVLRVIYLSFLNGHFLRSLNKYSNQAAWAWMQFVVSNKVRDCHVGEEIDKHSQERVGLHSCDSWFCLKRVSLSWRTLEWRLKHRRKVRVNKLMRPRKYSCNHRWMRPFLHRQPPCWRDERVLDGRFDQWQGKDEDQTVTLPDTLIQ